MRRYGKPYNKPYHVAVYLQNDSRNYLLYINNSKNRDSPIVVWGKSHLYGHSLFYLCSMNKYKLK